MANDRPVASADNDRLGFGDLAARLVHSLSGHAGDEGFVLGIVGAWGSGKSSLVNITRSLLRQSTSSDKATVIDFQPWTVGNRDALLVNLFQELAAGLDRYKVSQGDLSDERKERASKAAEGMRKFAAKASKFGDLIELASKAPALSELKWVAKVLKALHGALGEKSPAPSLAELKTQLTKSLRELDHKFIVTVDDVDRLEPSEVVEVMRLIRAVADFPNITYILCYDPLILKNSLEKELGVSDGNAFLEKIVQLTVMVPAPEPFRLRQWFADELYKIHQPRNHDELNRLKSVIDVEGGTRLKTPRDVVRTLDSIRFIWPALREEGGDLSDFVWLALIKNSNLILYRWIENYCAGTSLLSLGTATIDEGERTRDFVALMSTVGELGLENYSNREIYSHHLAGVRVNYGEEGAPLSIYSDVDDKARDEAIRGKRLSSPDHYRLYFALTGPSHALTQSNLDQFWRSVNIGASATAELLLDWHQELVAINLSKAELLLERLNGMAAASLPSPSCWVIIQACGEMLDGGYFIRPFERFSFNSLWDRATRLLIFLLPLLGKRSDAVSELFSKARALGWLTRLFRDEIFAHGVYGDRRAPERDWLLTAEEFDVVRDEMLNRYRAMTLESILSTPNSAEIFYAWRQAGDSDGPRIFLSQHVNDDDNLVRMLEVICSRSTSSVRGEYRVLHREDVDRFFDYGRVCKRLASIASLPPSDLATRAQSLIGFIRNGEQD